MIAQSLFAAVLLAASLPEAQPLVPERPIPLPDVQGRIDHLSVDRDGKRLFVAALGNNTVEVVDLAQGKVSRTLKDLSKPQGVLYVPQVQRLFVANGGDGTVRIFDGAGLEPLGQVSGLEDADNLRWDAARRQLLVGYGQGAIAVLHPSGRKLADAPLPAHPESFQLDDGSVYINVPGRSRVLVIELGTPGIAAEWRLGVEENFPMALDADRYRLFIASRKPARLLVLDTRTGRVLSELPAVEDADDLFFDGANKRVYVIGGGGQVSIFEEADVKTYRAAGTVPTAPGARTGLFVPEWKRLFVACPRQVDRGAEIMVFKTE